MKWFKDKILGNNKNLLLFVAIVCFLVMVIYQSFLLFNDSYFHSNSDDVVQYSPILGQYIRYFKEGKLSWFNYSNNSGASVYADIYYLPIDIFSLLTFLFSFLCDDIIAFSCVELLKVVLGTIVFAYFLLKCNYKRWVVLFISLVYFCCGGAWAFATYPTYFSLFFYLPCSLLMVKYYNEGKKWVLPLYCVALILYNFYNAYTLFIFMLFGYVVSFIRDNYFNFKKLLKEIFVFGLHIVLGVVMGLFILLPSILYILNYTSRDYSDFKLFYYPHFYFKLIYHLFVYETGVTSLNLNSPDGGVYFDRHYSYYIGIFNLVVLSFLFFMKDKASKVYKWSLGVILVFMIFPIFSMIFSGVGIAYTRWFSFINIVLLYYLGHVLNNCKIGDFSRKDKKKVFISFLVLYSVSFGYGIYKLISDVSSLYYVFYVVMCVITLVFMLLYGLFYFFKHYDMLYLVVGAEMIVVLLFNFSVPFSKPYKELIVDKRSELNDSLEKLDIDEGSLERVHVDSLIRFNNNRFVDSAFVNEFSFHSFFTKYSYYFSGLYDNSVDGELINDYFNRYDPYYSRVLDYKYVMVSNDGRDYHLDFLKEYYKDDNYIVYLNENYNPFYVYESFYSEVMNVEDGDLVQFEDKLFDGVILDGEYNLKEIPFSYIKDDSEVLYLDEELKLVKEDDGKYVSELGIVKEGFSGSFIVKADDYSNIEKVSIVSDGKSDRCVFDGVYICNFSNKIDEIVIDSDGEIDGVRYLVILKDEVNDEEYLLLDVEGKISSDTYLSFDLNFYEGMYELVFIDEENNYRYCLNGFCSLKEFVPKYLKLNSGLFNSDVKLKLIYQEKDLDKYLNYSNMFGINKSLSYNKSVINVKYTRDSLSEYDQVVVLPVTYSDEWVCDNPDYELVRVNGSFLGIVVKNEIKEIDVSVSFKPNGVKEGFICSFVGLVIYGIYIGVYFVKRKEEVNENV